MAVKKNYFRSFLQPLFLVLLVLFSIFSIIAIKSAVSAAKQKTNEQPKDSSQPAVIKKDASTQYEKSVSPPKQPLENHVSTSITAFSSQNRFPQPPPQHPQYREHTSYNNNNEFRYPERQQHPSAYPAAEQRYPVRAPLRPVKAAPERMKFSAPIQPTPVQSFIEPQVIASEVVEPVLQESAPETEPESEISSVTSAEEDDSTEYIGLAGLKIE